jgi:hypothetical protein
VRASELMCERVRAFDARPHSPCASVEREKTCEGIFRCETQAATSFLHTSPFRASLNNMRAALATPTPTKPYLATRPVQGGRASGLTAAALPPRQQDSEKVRELPRLRESRKVTGARWQWRGLAGPGGDLPVINLHPICLLMHNAWGWRGREMRG